MDLNFTVGVEEEFLIVDASTGELRSKADRLLPGAREVLGDGVASELNLSQIETGTPVCATLEEVRTELHRLRREIISVAERVGCEVITAGTHPTGRWQEQQINQTKDRYRFLEDEFQLTAKEQLVGGCHVHVGIADSDLAIDVLNRCRPWLSPLLALSANSPFWMGVDSGYASYRSQVWGSWPLTGMPEPLESRADFDRLVDDLVAVGAIRDASFIYWDVRPSISYETLEFRIADSCLTVDEAVMVAGLVRGLARTAAAEALAGVPTSPRRGELAVVAKWRAARSGLESTLVDVVGNRHLPAADVVASFLGYVQPALEELGDWDEVRGLVGQTLSRGNGAQRQRGVFAQRERLDDVLQLLIAETAAGVA